MVTWRSWSHSTYVNIYIYKQTDKTSPTRKNWRTTRRSLTTQINLMPPHAYTHHTTHTHTYTYIHIQEATLLDGIRAGVAAGLRCQRCGPAHLAIGGQGEGAAAVATPLPEWAGSLGSEGDEEEEGNRPPHPCDALKAALAALRADPRRRGQTVVTMGSAAGVGEASGHLIRAVLAHHGAGNAGALTRRVETALHLLRTLLVLDDAALLSSPMEVRFAFRLGGKDGEGEGEGDEELVGAALDMFLIERDPAKYDSLR
jgi:hypothetical protein